jgi:hypothetical protein
VVVALGVMSARLFVWPAEGMPARVDAIVMLAGPGDRLPVALRLAREHRAHARPHPDAALLQRLHLRDHRVAALE